MKHCTRTLFLSALLLLAASAQAAPQATHNGYFASATWSMGGWPIQYMTQSIGPYITYGDCYTAWTQLVHSQPQYWLESTVPCHFVSTHMAYVEVAELAIDGDGGAGGGGFGGLDDILEYVDRVRELRRQYNIDGYEAALERLK